MADAHATFQEYTTRSILGLGSAAHERVTLLQSGEPLREHDPQAPKPEDVCRALTHATSAPWTQAGTRAQRGRVTVWWNRNQFRAEYAGQDYLGRGDTPTEALAHLQGQLSVLVEQIKESL
jgi:hypothetical protein